MKLNSLDNDSNQNNVYKKLLRRLTCYKKRDDEYISRKRLSDIDVTLGKVH